MRACWYRCRVPLQNASSGCCCQSAGVAAGGGCGMSMAVWTLGPDGDDIDAVAKKKARAWLPPKTDVLIWGLCWRIVFGFENKSEKIYRPISSTSFMDLMDSLFSIHVQYRSW